MLRVLGPAHQQTSPKLMQVRRVIETERARHLPNDRHDKLSNQNKVLMSRVRHLSEVEATRNQESDHQPHREAQFMRGNM